MTLAARATVLMLKARTKTILSIPEIVIALAGTLVLGLIFANALGIMPSCESTYDNLDDPRRVALIADAADIIAAKTMVHGGY